MTVCKKPIRRSLLIYGTLFLAILCALMSFQSASVLNQSLDERNYAHLKDIVAYVEHTVDADDLRECIRTRTPSERYDALQRRLNTMVDDFEVEFIYVVIPSAEDGILYSVCSSVSQAEREAGDEEYPIMFGDPDFYTAEQLVPYVNAWEKTGEFTDFKSYSDYWGNCYTVCKTIQASDGERVALICADLTLDDLQAIVNTYIVRSVILVVLIGILFALGVSLWLQKNITSPLLALEESTRGFAQKSHENRADIADVLTFDQPNIQTENEIQSLSMAIKQMSDDMKSYVEDILSAEKRAEAAEGEIAGITKLAYEDSLTKAGSKVAFEARRAEVAEAIKNGDTKVAIVVVNLNDLKRINDIYGLDGGNKYIISGCEILRQVYREIPVYRVGSDDFVVILQGDAYRDRDELYAVLEEQFYKAQDNTEVDPWERCSAAAGMTEFFDDADTDIDQVYRRAEMIMSRNKRIMKSERK